MDQTRKTHTLSWLDQKLASGEVTLERAAGIVGTEVGMLELILQVSSVLPAWDRRLKIELMPSGKEAEDRNPV